MRPLAVVLGALLITAQAVASEPRLESRAAFRRGVAFAQEGQFAKARDAFAEAYRLFPHPSILLNLGVARAQAGERVQAERDLVQFLADDGGASVDEVAGARAALAEARSHLGTYRVRLVPDTGRLSIDGHSIALAPGERADVRLAEGPHDVVAEAATRLPARRRVVIVPGGIVEETILLSPRAVLGTPDGHLAERPERPSTQTWIGGLLLGGGATALGVGLVTGLRAVAQANDHNSPGTSRYLDPVVRAEGVAMRTTADLALATAVVFGAAGLVVLLTRPSPSGRVPSGEHVNPN